MTKKVSSKDLPVIKCFPHYDQVRFWCPFCEKWHYHGRVGITASRKSHRHSHCSNIDSPYRNDGYYIKLFPKEDIKELVDALEAYIAN